MRCEIENNEACVIYSKMEISHWYFQSTMKNTFRLGKRSGSLNTQKRAKSELQKYSTNQLAISTI